ncbi:MAG: hypothetical protein HC860_05690 [Alkalinema sp. RU_4_3]|nr:hypothetical protein [Alkalinema sp. RU_4_3]
MVLSLIPKPKYEEEEAAAGSPRTQAVTDFSDGALAQTLPISLPEKILGKVVAVLTPPEGLPGPVKLFYRPIFLGVLALHAALIFAPAGGPPKGEKPAEKEKPLTITQVATGKAQPKLTKVPLSKLPPPTKPTLPKLDRPTPPTAPVVKTPDAPTPPPKADTPPPAATPQNSTPPANLPNVTPAPPGGGAKAGDPFENFLDHPQAKGVGAYFEVSSETLAAVETFFKGQKGFEVKDGAGPTGDRKVLAISAGGKAIYIGLFKDGSGTVYIKANSEAEIPDSLDKVKKVKAMPVAYVDVIQTAGASGGVSINDFSDPSPYMIDDTTNANGVLKIDVFTSNPNDTYARLLASGLQAPNCFKSITPEAPYKGGPLYKMTSDTGDFYLNIVPAVNGTDSIVVLFSDRPS